MAKVKYHSLYRADADWWIIIGPDDRPTTDGPYPGRVAGREAVERRLIQLCARPRERIVRTVTHYNGYVTIITAVGGGNGHKPTYKISGQNILGHKIRSAAHFVSIDAAEFEATHPPRRVGGGRVVHGTGFGPKFRGKPSLAQIEYKRAQRNKF